MTDNTHIATLYVLVGLPGSGKSTWRDANAKDSVVLSTDDYLDRVAAEKGLSYSEVFKQEYKNALTNLNAECVTAVKTRENIVWDQTNMSKNKRRGILGRIPICYRKVAVLFEVDPDELRVRLDKRAEDTGKVIQDVVIQKMLFSYTPPSVEEGFDEVIVA